MCAVEDVDGAPCQLKPSPGSIIRHFGSRGPAAIVLSNDALLQMTWSELCAEHWGARAALYSVCYNAKLNMTCKLVQRPLKYDVFRLVDIQTH